jgi:hypothetical protein
LTSALAPVDKTMLPSRSGRRQCWAARTKDGIWAFAREEDKTTSWTVRHLPTKTVTEGFFGSLRQCRAYVASGEAQEDFDRIQAEAATRGEASA